MTPLGRYRMSHPESPSPQDRSAELRRLADERSRGLLSEFREYLSATRKWWLLPILLALLLIAFLLLASSSPWGLLLYPI